MLVDVLPGGLQLLRLFVLPIRHVQPDGGKVGVMLRAHKQSDVTVTRPRVSRVGRATFEAVRVGHDPAQQAGAQRVRPIGSGLTD
jgi:hypothetical protein